MRLGFIGRQLHRFLPRRLRSRTLSCMRIQLRQVQIGPVGIFAPAQNHIQLGGFTERNDVAGVMLEYKLVLVERLFPLLGLHVAETETAACRRVVWELS